MKQLSPNIFKSYESSTCPERFIKSFDGSGDGHQPPPNYATTVVSESKTTNT